MLAVAKRRWAAVATPGLTAALTFIAFLPSLRNEFVSWDDLLMFPGNPRYRGLGWAQLSWIWTTPHVGEYMPVTWMTYAADYLLWGLEPFGYHLTNLLLHVLTTLVVYRLGLRLLMLARSGGTGPGESALHVAAGVAALSFAIHPLRAEPVAWVSARGSILGGLFLLLSVLAYLEASTRSGTEPGRRGWLAGSLGLYALALLARSTNVMLPLVLLVLDVYPLRRLGGGAGRWLGPEGRRVWWEKLAFLALAAVVLPLAVLARLETKGVFGREPYDWTASTAVALFGLASYLRQTLLLGVPFSPVNEMPLQLNPLEWRFLVSGAVVLLISVLLIVIRRRWPAGLTAWACYVTILLPTSGIIPFGLQMTADRYTYVACLGWAFLAGAGTLAWWEAWRGGRIGTPAGVVTVGLAVTTVAGLGILTWNQVQVWRDSKTLWTYALAVEPWSGTAHASLGLVLEREGRLGDAVAHFRQAAQIWPRDAAIHTNLGRALARQGRPSEAEAHLRTAVRLRPGFEVAHLTLGRALASQGRLDEAIKSYRTATRLRPDSAPIHFNLGRALAEAGSLDEAVAHFEAALRLRPDFVEARSGLNLVLQRLEERTRGRGV